MRPAPLLLLASLTGCAKETPSSPRSCLLVTLDTWRADHFDALHTPNLHALASQGWSFSKAWSPMGLTSPAHASILSGLQPWRHGMRANNHHGFELPGSAETLAEKALAAGFQTAAFVSAWPAGPSGGLDQGFSTFEGPESGERPGEIAVDAALRWMSALPREERFFLWVHLYEPHGPYTPPPEDLRAVGGGEDDRAHYGGEVHAADRKLRPLLRAVERKRDVLVVVAGDHGEVLDEEPCGWQHERSSGEGVLRVPLAFAGPGLAPNRRDDVALLVDITPTVLDLLGFPPLAESDGLSLRVPVRRDTWWGESGMCERTCAPGCEPPGLLGRDRVVRGEGWRLVDRPGRGPFVEGRGTPPAPSTWATLLHELPRLEVLPPSASEEQARALGYVEPR